MKLFSKIRSGNVLYYPGCLTKYVLGDIANNYKIILDKIGADYIQLRDLESCCGSPILNSGHTAEALRLAKNNFEIFKDHNVKKIITSCPACSKTLGKDYPNFLSGWDIEVEHISLTIYNAMKIGQLKPKYLGIKFTYHDPCHLGRHCGIYREPRAILEKIGQLNEMKLNGRFSFCCGGGSGVKSNYSDLSNSIAKERIKMAAETKADCFVTTCPMCYIHIKENSEKMDVKEISQLLGDSDNSD